MRVVRSARRHKIGNAHILAAMINAGEPVVVDTGLGPQLHYVAEDDRGVELHVIAVPDNRREGGLAVIHAMPTSYPRTAKTLERRPSDTDQAGETEGEPR